MLLLNFCGLFWFFLGRCRPDVAVFCPKVERNQEKGASVSKCTNCHIFLFFYFCPAKFSCLCSAVLLLLVLSFLPVCVLRTCRGPSMTCLPVQRAPWVPAWARQGCRVARASRATLLSRPSLLTHLHTCQASEGLHLPRPVPLPAPAHPAQDRCHLPTCQVGLHSEIGHMIISGLLTCLIVTAMPDYWPVLLKLLEKLLVFAYFWEITFTFLVNFVWNPLCHFWKCFPSLAEAICPIFGPDSKWKHYRWPAIAHFLKTQPAMFSFLGHLRIFAAH